MNRVSQFARILFCGFFLLSCDVSRVRRTVDRDQGQVPEAACVLRAISRVPGTSDIRESNKHIWDADKACGKNPVHLIFYSFAGGESEDRKMSASVLFCMTPDQHLYFENYWDQAHHSFSKKPAEEWMPIRSHLQKIEKSIEDTCNLPGLSKRLVEDCSMVDCSKGM